MSKFFITNNSEFFHKVKKRGENSPYSIAFEYEGNGIYAISSKKLTIDNQNGIQCENGFIIVTGTMAWGAGSAINMQTLQKIHQSFHCDINNIRQHSIGNFAVSIMKEGVLYVFGEIAGFYNIYFYNTGHNWLISNSLYDMAAVLNDKLTLNKLALIESTVQDGILLGDTYYNEIHRLSGFNYLKIKEGELELIEEEKMYPMAKGTLDEKVEKYKNLSKLYGGKMASAYGRPCISMTGGLDARMVLSSYMAAGVKPELYYGTGNSFITNTYHEDKEIDKVFSQKFGLIFHDESWETPEPIDKYWEKYLDLYGFFYETYAWSDKIFESIKKTPCQLFTFGYCGELLRSLPWIEASKKDFFTLEEYLNDFYLPNNVMCEIIPIDEYRKYIRTKYLKICKLYHLDINHIANEDIFYLSLERRKSADAVMLNLVNFMKYCSYSLGQYEHLCAGRITCEEAENSSFMLHCLDALYPSVLEVPVFSHCTFRKFNRETMSLSPQNRTLLWRELIKFMKKNIPWLFDFIKRIIRNGGSWKSQGTEEDKYILSLYGKYDEYGVFNSDKFDDKRRLVSCVMKMYALASLNK